MSIENIQTFFKENDYVVVRNFIDSNLANIMYNYCLMAVKVVDFKSSFDKESYIGEYDGWFGDGQVPNSFCKYGDILMDTLLDGCYKKIAEFTDINLLPTYSYWRLYFTGSDLKSHIDRNSCEISFTLNLGQDITNLEDQSYIWPIHLKNKDDEVIDVLLNPGDMLIYKGCDLVHWREPFEGLNLAQVFLHFNNASDANLFDGRPMLGLPAKYKNTKQQYSGE